MRTKLSSKLHRNQAMALVIALAFIVLLSGLVSAYFLRSLCNRRLSSSSFHQARADELARSALDIITGCLKQEIVNGSQSTGTGSNVIYEPLSNANMVPVRNGAPPLSSGSYPIPTLLRISTTGSIAAPGVDFLASNAITTNPSANGRSITRSRWNEHYLIPRDLTIYKPTTKLGTEPVPAFTPPKWVFITDQGPTPLSQPSRAVQGRYAYAIYDESALLDVNVAGYPLATTGHLVTPPPASYTWKGSAAFADLTRLNVSNVTCINNIVGWRNYASVHHGGDLKNNFTFSADDAYNDFQNWALFSTSGFLQVSGSVASDGRTDQAFMNRQELLRFSRATTGTIIPQDALQYLGTFSRAVTMPSWIPQSPGSPNFDLLKLRFLRNTNVQHYRDDGVTTNSYSVTAGQPFLQRRFSLARLGWLTTDGPKGNTAEAIHCCFGLLWDSDGKRWKYVGATGNSLQSTIKNLDEIAAETPAREPDFFELLKAGILSSSLTGTSSKDSQIIQIGANIIDQADSDSQSTAIVFGSVDSICHGVETVSPPKVINILNRAFRSVGELGYAWRDTTGNNIDFSTQSSSDTALLDLFCVNEAELQVVAGQINPNNAPGPVLQAVFSNTLLSNTSTTVISGTDPGKLANAFIALTATSPICNRSDLPARLNLAIQNSGVALSGTLQKEAPIRALASVTNTRTWNLMIDVIAQSGVFPPSAQTLDNFVVQGERRYWLHIAIDRYTGLVIDRQLEPVDE